MGDAALHPQTGSVGGGLLRRFAGSLCNETPLGRAVLCAGVGASLLVWCVAAGLALSGLGWDGAPAEIADGVVSGLAVAAGVVGTFAVLLLATSAPGRRRWLLLGAGLFFVVAGEAADSVRAVVVATGGSGPSVGRAGLADVFVISALGLLETAAVGILGLGAERREGWRASVLVPAGSALLVLALWAALDVAAGAYRARTAGVLLLLSAAAGLGIGIWRRHGRLDRVDSVVGLAIVLLAESGAAAAVGGARSWLGIVGSALLRATAVLVCMLCFSAELFSRLSARRRRLERALERTRRLRSELRHRELDRRGAEHELRAALLVVRSGIELIERALVMASEDPTLDEAIGYLRTGVASVGSLLSAPAESSGQGRVEDLRAVVETEVGAARRRGVDAHLAWGLGTWPEPGAAIAEPDALGRVLRELLQNSECHAPGTAVAVQVWSVPDAIVVRVEDAGPGLPPAVVERWASGRAGRIVDGALSSGHGLGLVLVRSLVEGVGGAVMIGCRPGGPGTRVEVCWPVYPAERGTAPIAGGTALRPRLAGARDGSRFQQ